MLVFWGEVDVIPFQLDSIVAFAAIGDCQQHGGQAKVGLGISDDQQSNIEQV